jgi:exodeoxyribonuclease-5
MLKNHIARLMQQQLGYDPTPGQERLIDLIASFVTDSHPDNSLLIKGYAGTGKTTIISALVNTMDSLGQKTILLAPTGRAAKVLAHYSGKNAFTIHKKIYRQRSSKDAFGTFALDRNLYSDTLFLVDEASMISNQLVEKNVFGTGRLLDDLIQFVKNDQRCRLILVGDTAQLPPVHTSLSPALEKTQLQLYFSSVEEFELSDVIRQSKQSGILVNATQIRNSIIRNKPELPMLKTSGFTDIRMITGNDLQESLSQCYDRDGIENTILICRSNKRANKFNEGIRKQILDRESELTQGDLLMVVKNNYYWLTESENIDFIANGDIVKILKIRKLQEIYGFRFADALVELADYGITMETKLWLDTLAVEAPALSQEDNRKLFYAIMEDYGDLKSQKSQFEKVKSNAFFNALQVKFAYAVTCHKAQGGQWKNVFIDIGYFQQSQLDIDFLRWLYTAFTRATQKLYLVNFPETMIDH